MEKRIITDSSLLPEEITLIKQRHFREVFGDSYLNVLNDSPLIDIGEEVLIFEEQGRPIGWVNFKRDVYCVKFRNFSVHPEFRVRGIARALMEELAAVTAVHHEHLLKTGEKPRDIGLMFLKSLVYFDADREGAVFAFGKFLKKMGFVPYAYNQNDISPEEVAGTECYRSMYPENAGNLKVFKKIIIDTGVDLKSETKAELRRLTPEARNVVMDGLSWKIGHYAKSGRVSYRYDLCPICAYVGSSEKNSAKCKVCPIYITCMEPFRAVGKFKEDYEVSGAYFRAVRDFLLSCAVRQ